MSRLTRLAPFALALVAVTSLDACRKKPKATPEPTNIPAATTTTDPNAEARERARQDSIARAQRQRFVEDSIRAAEAARSGDVASLRRTLLEPVYFDYDQAELRADTRQSLDAKLPILTANPSLTIRIAGHTDERGSEEYNLALGQRRAAEARRYLVERGVSQGRIEIVSFGEAQPAANGATEDAWAQNRRAEFEITAGGDALRRPRS
jgi:peptidoglycan-associated lipoprotein